MIKCVFKSLKVKHVTRLLWLKCSNCDDEDEEEEDKYMVFI